MLHTWAQASPKQHRPKPQPLQKHLKCVSCFPSSFRLGLALERSSQTHKKDLFPTKKLTNKSSQSNHPTALLGSLLGLLHHTHQGPQAKVQRERLLQAMRQIDLAPLTRSSAAASSLLRCSVSVSFHPVFFLFFAAWAQCWRVQKMFLLRVFMGFLYRDLLGFA